MLKSLLYFIGGKPTNIFNKKGKVEHKFPEEKWKQWDARLKDNPQYNWREHTGKQSHSQDTKKN
ncbi:MAG: hypothetical protein KDD33_09285 [Bdellovibrionales bacterium]|nr:hypothetical protein [Bdellovibrionales bacterium]